jgi:cytochrome c oxidase subunit 1
MASTATVAAPHPRGRAKEPTGLWSWITTVDHKRIGILYGTTAFLWFLVAGIEALMIRVQLFVPNNHFVSAETYNSLFTMHALTMIFGALMPLTAAFFNFIVPLQIGARDVAFPRLNALSYWLFLFGSLFLNFGWLLKAAPDSGWFAYAPITTLAYSPGLHMDFYVLGLQVLGLSSIIASLNFIITIINLRAPGMRLMRMPIFTWMTLVTSVLIVTAMAVFTIAVTELMFDRIFGTNFYNTVSAGADPLLWQHLFWMFGHPEVYILIIPIMGMVSEVLPTFSRKPLFGYNVMVFSGVLIGWLGWGVWSHHMFATGMGPIADSFFALSTMLIAIPTGIKVFNWLGTLYGGSIRFTTAMLFSVGFIALFTIGGISGVMHSSAPSDLQQSDTYFIVAHIHYVFFGGTVMGLWSAIYYWYPKVFGRLLDEGLGKAALLGDLRGDEPDLLPHALRGDVRDAAAHLDLRRRPGLHLAQPAGDGGLVRHRPLHAGVRDQPVHRLEARAGGRQQPVGRGHAGVEHPLAAAGLQLPRDPGGALAHAALGRRPHQEPGGSRTAGWRRRRSSGRWRGRRWARFATCRTRTR